MGGGCLLGSSVCILADRLHGFGHEHAVYMASVTDGLPFQLRLQWYLISRWSQFSRGYG